MDSILKLLEQNIDKIPFFTMALGGKPRLNTAKLLEVSLPMSIVLGVLWSQMGAIDVKVDKVSDEQIRQSVRLENLTTTVSKSFIEVRKDIEKLNDAVFIPHRKMKSGG